MNIKQLIKIVEIKLKKSIQIGYLKIEDKSYLHKNHKTNEKGKFHLKLTIESEELNKLSKVNSMRIIYKILDEELKKYIHSIQIFIR
jgi:BolA family transcriptional regulator, general stress-responsive regulator|tara:strand:- start:4489 stop:4749 length:261 start_codon:yes stop_codon:yes gene_type:complete